MSSRATHLHIVHPESLGGDADRNAQAVELLRAMFPGLRPQEWSARLHALYFTGEGARLSRALGDRLWLHPRLLLPAGLPAAYWAGALDQLGRQHAGGGILLVAPRDAVRAAVSALLHHDRATIRRHSAARCELALHDGLLEPMETLEPRSEYGSAGRE